MKKRSAVTTAVFMFLAAMPSVSLAATVGQIIDSRSTYYGSHVNVRGTVEHLEQKVSHKGNPYVTLSHCSGPCIDVFALGTPGITDGQTIAEQGTNEALKPASGYTFYNEVGADDGSL